MGSTINLKAADGFTLSAYTAGPPERTKGIVVIQEIFGVNHHMRDMCDRFAAEGYAVCRAGDLRPRRDVAWSSATPRRTSTRAAVTA